VIAIAEPRASSVIGDHARSELGRVETVHPNLEDYQRF